MGSILYNIFIGPLELIINAVFSGLIYIYMDPYIALIGLSLFVSTVTLPLYNRADHYQLEGIKKRSAMDAMVSHIRKTFKGDERYFMLNAYYKEQDYKPYYALKSSLSLFLQIPFFMVAYNALSAYDYGDQFLSNPDGLLNVGGMTVNVLPVIMTLINLVSGYIYTRDMKFKDKWQVFLLPLVFLVLLYRSPAALIIYWTSNNIYSLIKNIIKASPYSRKLSRAVLALIAFLTVMTLVLSVVRYSIFIMPVFVNSSRSSYLLPAFMIPLMIVIPPVIFYKRSKAKKAGTLQAPVSFGKIFLIELAGFILLGVLVPTDLLLSSPIDFEITGVGDFINLSSKTLCVYAGVCFIWMNVIIFMTDKKVRNTISLVLVTVMSVFILDYFVVNKSHGVLSIFLTYTVVNDLPFESLEFVLSLGVIAAAAVLVFILRKHVINYIGIIGAVLVISLSVLSVKDYVEAKPTVDEFSKSVEEYKRNGSDMKDKFKVSKDGKNVFVIMLDRGVGAYVPFVMDEKPEIKKQFDGFTFYPNTVSTGSVTVLGAPGLFGGYEYTAGEMVKDNGKTAATRHDEALKLMPVTFYKNNYNVSLADLPFPGYTWTGDYSVFDEYEGMKTEVLSKSFTANRNIYKERGYDVDSVSRMQKEKIPVYSIFAVTPMIFQDILYDDGKYTCPPMDVISVATLSPYLMLECLPDLTEVTDTEENNFNMFVNTLVHEPFELQLPDYTFEKKVDNSAFDKTASHTVDGVTMKMGETNQYEHYHVFAATCRMLGDWFDYLRSEGVWDNTRIIIVSDHGRQLRQFDNMQVNEEIDVQKYNSILMYKDFGSEGFNVDNSFMTNADTPTLAFKDLIKDPVNPFTGNPVNSDAKAKGPVDVSLSENGVHLTTGNVLEIDDNPNWYQVSDNIFDPANWKRK